MAIFQSEDRLRLRRLQSEKAINLAMQSRWEEAVAVNRQILEMFPNDVDASNRLGKALMELGRYREAREAYNQSLKLDPVNAIAAKNLQRLSRLQEEAEVAGPAPSPVDPSLFIEESGKTVVTSLVDLAPAAQLLRITTGDVLSLEVAGSTVKVRDGSGEIVGHLEPKLGQRVIRLLAMGNRYSAVVTSVDERSLRVIIREVYRAPAMGTRPSFPTAPAPEALRGYIKDSALRYDLEEEEELIEESEAELEVLPESELGLEEAPLDSDELGEEA